MIEPVKSRTRSLTEMAIQELQNAVRTGTFPPGSQLPSEAELIRLLGISRTTVREALRQLEERGLIIRRHGVGTFVRSDSILNQLNENFSVVELIRDAKMKYGVSKVEIQTLVADREIANHLKLLEEEPVIMIERIRTADKNPVVYSKDYFPCSIITDIEAIKKEAGKESLYRVLRSQFNTTVSYGIAHLTSIPANEEVSSNLGLAPETPVMNLKQTDFDATEKPVLFTNDYYVPGIFDFVIFRKGGGIRS